MQPSKLKVQRYLIITWFCSLAMSWVNTSFDFLSLSITVLENPVRGGLGLLEYGELGLELIAGCGVGGGGSGGGGGAVTGHQP